MWVKRLKKDERKTILALSWRDICSPNAGGAEVHTHEMLKRMDLDKYRIIHLAAYYVGEKEDEFVDGIHYIRKGSILTVIWYAFCFYFFNRKEIDYVIEQCNTHRFFSPLWVPKEKRVFYIHQLTKEIWNYNACFPLNKIGAVLEESFLWLNRHDKVITVSKSTKKELIARGYDESKIVIIPNGISFDAWPREKWYRKEEEPTFIFVGRYSPYKGIDIAVEAFGKLHVQYKGAKFWILGKKDEEYIRQKLIPIFKKYRLRWGNAEEKADVVFCGFVTEEKKLELLSRAWALLFPSIREGWGIPITEAACVGTPSIVFNSPGIIDAVDGGRAGYVCKDNDEEGLFQQMKVVIEDKMVYNQKVRVAYDFSSQFRWDKMKDAVETVLKIS